MIRDVVASCLFVFNSFIFFLRTWKSISTTMKLNVHDLSVWKWNVLGGVINVQHLCKLVFLLSFQKVSIIFFFDISFNLSFREGSLKISTSLAMLFMSYVIFSSFLMTFMPWHVIYLSQLTHVMKHNHLYIKVLSNSIKLTWQDCINHTWLR